jgi:hypothetical protein
MFQISQTGEVNRNETWKCQNLSTLFWTRVTWFWKKLHFDMFLKILFSPGHSSLWANFRKISSIVMIQVVDLHLQHLESTSHVQWTILWQASSNPSIEPPYYHVRVSPAPFYLSEYGSSFVSSIFYINHCQLKLGMPSKYNYHSLTSVLIL